MKTKSPASALFLLLTLSLLLPGCATESPARKESLQIYQPKYLFLKAGQPVPTTEGTYTPQVDEIWYSAADYRALEQQLINATAALAQKNASAK